MWVPEHNMNSSFYEKKICYYVGKSQASIKEKEKMCIYECLKFCSIPFADDKAETNWSSAA